jgi:hypothetical protein
MRWLVAALAVLLWSGTYAVSCWWWPFAHCRCCHGTGSHARKDGAVFRPCRWCRGSGKRLRLGRRVYNFVHVRRERANGGG